MERRNIMRMVIATAAVVAFTAWNIHQVPLTADGVPYGVWVWPFWILVGAIWGRWPAVCLPVLSMFVIIGSGVENFAPIGDMGYGASVIFGFVFRDLPMTVLGIGVVKLLGMARRRRQHA